MAEHTGWRNFWWLNVALLGVSFSVSLFLFPETRFARLPGGIIDSKESHSPKQPLTKEPQSSEEIVTPSNIEKDAAGSLGVPLGHGKPGRSQFNIFQPNSRFLQSLLFDIITPFHLFAFPIVDLAAFVVSWSASCFLTVNLTQAQAFASPPYMYTPQKIGFFNFAVVIGQLLGLATAGPLNDWISMRATRRNNGIREPEMRLPAMIPYALIMILGNFIVAFGYQYHWDWRVRLFTLFTSDRSFPLLFLTVSLEPKSDWCILLGNCHHRLHLRRHPGCSASRYLIHLRY